MTADGRCGNNPAKKYDPLLCHRKLSIGFLFPASIAYGFHHVKSCSGQTEIYVKVFDFDDGIVTGPQYMAATVSVISTG